MKLSQTTLVCGTPLSDLEPGQPLYVVSAEGEVRITTNFGIRHSGGQWYILEDGKRESMRFAYTYANRGKAYDAAESNAIKFATARGTK